MKDKYIIFEYSNEVEMRFGGGSIFFIFDKGFRASTNIFLYDSYDKIQKGDSGFINYLAKKSLNGTKYFEINDKDSFFKEKTIYYIVLNDNKNYDDSIYIVNTLDFYLLYDNQYFYYEHTIDPELIFNFVIPKNSSRYFHYQTTRDPFNAMYNFTFKDSGGKTYIDEKTSGVNNIIKLKPNLEYYIRISIRKSKSYWASSFILSFSEYGRNYWIKNDDDIKLYILSSQHYSFYRSISNLNISDDIIFKGNLDLDFQAEKRFYIKYYDIDNFEILYENFPSSGQFFDEEISSHSGKFQVKLKKTNKSQKGILLGIFINSRNIMMEHSNLTVYGLSKSKDDEDDNSFYLPYWAVDIIMIIIVIILFGICICCCRGCSSSDSTSEGLYISIFKVDISTN